MERRTPEGAAAAEGGACRAALLLLAAPAGDLAAALPHEGLAAD